MIDQLLKLLTLRWFIFLSGLLHLCQIPAIYFAPKMLNWKAELAKLTPINARIYVVIGVAITIVVIGLGIVVMSASAELAAGGRLAAGVMAFLAVFWAYRAAIQIFLYTNIWPGGWMGRLSHVGLALLLTYLAVSYAVFFVMALR